MKKKWKISGVAHFLVLALGLCGCTKSMSPSGSSSETVFPMPQIQYTEEWPQNSFTVEIPKPVTGKVQWIWEHPNGEGFSISLTDSDGPEVEQYLEELASVGFRTVEKQVRLSGETDTIIYLGTNGTIGVSLQYTQGGFGMYLSKNLQGLA